MTDRFSQVKTDVLQTLFNQDIELKNNITPDTDNSYDLGTPARRIRSIYAGSVVGTISNPNVDTDNLRFPFTGPQDIRVTRAGPSQLQIDNNAGGAAQVVINGSLQATSINATAIAATALRNVSITPGTPNVGDVLKATSGTTAEWQTGGDITGPASAGNNDIVRYDGSSGKFVKDSNVTLDDAGNIVTPGEITASTITSPNNRATSLRNVALPLTAPVINQILRATSDTTAEWANVAGTGDVVGPASSIDNRIVLFDGTSGKTLKENIFWSITSNNLQCEDPFTSTSYFSFNPSLGTFSAIGPNATQSFLTTRRITDTQQTFTVQNNGAIIWSNGVNAPDLRISRGSGSNLTVDNNSTGAATISSNAGTLSNFATITRAGALAVTTSASNGNITYTCNGSGSHIFNSTSGNMQINRPITTASGDLTLNPAGSNIACSSKNLTGVASVQTTSITTAAGDVSINPAGTNINMNSKTLSNVANISSAGALTVSTNANGSITVTPNGTGNYNVTLGNWNYSRVWNNATTGNIVFQTPTGVSAGFQSINFNGFVDSSAVSTRFNTGKRYWRKVVDQRSTTDAYFIDSFDGTTNREYIRIEPSVSEQVNFPQGLRTGTIATASGDLSLNPAGTNIITNSKNITGANTFIMNNSASVLGTPKIQIFDTGTARYGFGLQSSTLSYETATATDSHVFYTGGTERARINNSVLQLAVPITTGAGDLSLNPAGSNINCNNKILTNVSLANTTYIRSLCVSRATGTNFGNFSTAEFDFFPVGDLLTGSLTIPANYFNEVGKGIVLEAVLRVDLMPSGTFSWRTYLAGSLYQNSTVSAISAWNYKLQIVTVAPGAGGSIGVSLVPSLVQGSATLIFPTQSTISFNTTTSLVIRIAGAFSASAACAAQMNTLKITSI